MKTTNNLAAILFAATLAAMAGACSSNNSPSGQGGGSGGGTGGAGGGSGGGSDGTTACNLVVSGAFSTTLTACATSTLYTDVDGGSYAIQVDSNASVTLTDGGSGLIGFTFIGNGTGAYSTGSWDSCVGTFTTLSELSQGDVAETFDNIWEEGCGGSASATGTFNLVLTSAGTSDSTGQIYTGLHGTLTVGAPTDGLGIDAGVTVSGSF